MVKILKLYLLFAILTFIITQRDYKSPEKNVSTIFVVIFIHVTKTDTINLIM